MVTLRGQFARSILFIAILAGMLAALPMSAFAAPYAAYVMDARTGETLYSKNADARLHPASLTKMLTLYIVFDAIRRGEISLDTMVTVSKNAAAQPPSRLGLKAGQRIALRHLIRAAAIKSANDAASAIGDALGGNEAQFATRMNRTAKALGMKNSTFKNANGLTEAGHLSTARDMSILGRRLFYDFPQYYNIFSRRETDAGVADVANTNRRFLDNYEGADGIKTGYTVAAGFNLTASAERGGVRIIASVFGGTSTAQRNAKMAELLDIGFAKAPAGAATRKPDAVDVPVEPVPDLVAGAEGAMAKTIRLVTVLKSSPRPRARPAASGNAVADAAATAAAVAALQTTINDAVADAVEPEAAATASPLPFAVIGDAAAAPPAGSGLPFQVVDADGNPVVNRADTDPADLLPTLDPSSAVDPVARETALAQVADAADLALPDPLATETPTGVIEVAASAAADPAQVAETAGDLAMAAPLTVLLPLPVANVTPDAPEVVVRLSTQGGRNWGVVLGRHPARMTAERVLIKAMLTESVALGDGLRKAVPKSGGYDATVLGLTEEQADLACRRLVARGQDCITLGP